MGVLFDAYYGTTKLSRFLFDPKVMWLNKKTPVDVILGIINVPVTGSNLVKFTFKAIQPSLGLSYQWLNISAVILEPVDVP